MGALQLVDKHSPYDKQFIYAGGARGGKARLESDQMSRKALPCKACVERSDYFRAARRHKNNDIISGCRKSRRLFRQPEWLSPGRQPVFLVYRAANRAAPRVRSHRSSSAVSAAVSAVQASRYQPASQPDSTIIYSNPSATA